MKQETLKEASDNYAEKVFNDRPNLDNDSKIWLVGGSIEGFKEGAKWQQEQDKNKFSEKDLREAYNFGKKFDQMSFEDFKKTI